jgi:hypothetical protein
MIPSFDVPPWAPCPKCSQPVSVYVSNIINYLNQAPVDCGACGEELDWWKVARQSIEENFMGNQALSFIGSETTVFSVQLCPGKRTVYRLSEYGVPLGSKVLYINYTPNGPGTLFPLEVHGNVSTQRFRTDEVVLYPMPTVGKDSQEETNIYVMVTWVPHGRADESWQNLFDAFEAFISGKFSSVIVPANVAVESSLLRLMTSYFDQFVGRKRTEDFLSNAATYSYQLNVLLPTFAELNCLPRLPQHIVGSLNRLRSLRNGLAHTGKTDTPLTRNDASEILCGALFGFHYVRYLQNQLGLDKAE